jgi:hypothetical protein
MKIRIKGNSIRFRLTKKDVTRFATEGWVEEKTVFPGGINFRYVLSREDGITEMNTRFSHNCISILVPASIAEEWTSTEIVGFDNNVELENGDKLFLLIEKDFACLDHTTEDQSDMYPNPNKTC